MCAVISSLHYPVFRVLTKIHYMLFPAVVPKLGIYPTEDFHL